MREDTYVAMLLVHKTVEIMLYQISCEHICTYGFLIVSNYFPD